LHFPLPDGDEADAQLRELERVQDLLEPRLNRVERIYSQAQKSLWIGNAGAALAMLSLIGTTWRGGPPSRLFLLTLGFFIAGLILMGIGEIITLVKEGRAIRRIQDAKSVMQISLVDVESPIHQSGLYLSPRTLCGALSGICFVVGVIVGFASIGG
jgi:hypothetical protein